MPCDAVFLDFRKAFDTIPYPELLFKVWFHGITGPLWSWFQAYLSNRSHYVFVEGSSSNILPVKSGVPRGSVLGPLLFLIYVNDIPDAITFCRPYLLLMILSFWNPSITSHHVRIFNKILTPWPCGAQIGNYHSTAPNVQLYNFSSPLYLPLYTSLMVNPSS